MDDFFVEMQDVFSDLKKGSSTSSTATGLNGQGEDSPFLAQYFPNMFADALVPINPRRWPSFTAGSAMSSEMPDFGEKVKTPLNNLLVAKEYLETSQSDIQWRSRFWELMEDTGYINGVSETGDIGSFVSGAYSNKIADRYVDKMVETTLTLNDYEKLNHQIFKQVAREQNLDPESVRGTGVVREFVPSYMQDDICNRPERNARPRPFDDDGLYGDGPIIGPNQDGPNLGGSSGGSSLGSDFESSNFQNPNELNSHSNSNDNINDSGTIFGSSDAPGIYDNSLSTSTDGYSSSECVSYDGASFAEKMWNWFIGEGGGVPGVSDPTCEAFSPPMFLGECGPPQD